MKKVKARPLKKLYSQRQELVESMTQAALKTGNI